MLEQAAAALKRLENFVLRLPADDGGAVPESAEVRDAREAMLAALDDDFDTPAALGALFAFIREQNRRDQPAAGARRLMEDFDRIFGVLPAAGAGPGATGESDDWIQGEVDRRQQMRAERDFAEADAIRDRLKEMGVVVEDTADGVRWHREGAAG
jgi:cysteinyl-tRNA synthetase